jgi:hypothetical protein
VLVFIPSIVLYRVVWALGGVSRFSDQFLSAAPRTASFSRILAAPLPFGPMVQSEFFNLSAQRITVNSQHLGSSRLIAVVAIKYAFDELPLKFAHSIVV